VEARAYLRKQFEHAADSGFPLLARIPATQVVRFLDYFASLAAADRADLLDALADCAASLLNGRAWPETAARQRLLDVLVPRGPGTFVGGLRYTDVKFLAGVPRLFGSMDAWLGRYSDLARRARADLLPDPARIEPARAADLRKRVKAVLRERGYAASACYGSTRFLSPDGILVDCDFGSRLGQLRWSVLVGAERPDLPMHGHRWISYERLWSLSSDWDYITVENAPRSIEALPGLVDETVRLAGLRSPASS
jgi:hypothetical protein